MASYLLRSVICSGILIMVYHLFLAREKMHLFNRCYLLLSMVFSLSVPLLTLKMKQELMPAPLVTTLPNMVEKLELTAVPDRILAVVPDDSSVQPVSLISLVFYLVSCLLLVRFVLNIRSLLHLKGRCKILRSQQANLVLVPGDVASYTFLNNIFLPEKSFESGQLKSEILAHEMAHVRQMHSLDILFFELLQAVMWFNPFLIFYQKAIRLNHEFLADATVLEACFDVKSYQLLLLDSLMDSSIRFTSSFNYSVTKKRLAMMTRNKNRRRQFFKQVAIGLLAFILTMTFSEKISAQIETGVRKVSVVLPALQTVSQEPNPRSAENRSPERSAGPGISKPEADEFYTTIAKHTTYVTNKKGLKDPLVRIDPKRKDQLYALYAQMNSQQQQAVRDSGIMIWQMPIPVKQPPTPEMFAKWKRKDVFGIWIDGRHVPNAALEKYKNTDIAEYDLSKLYGAALRGRIYKYQLDLTTNADFDKNYQQRVNDRVFLDRFIRFNR